MDEGNEKDLGVKGHPLPEYNLPFDECGDKGGKRRAVTSQTVPPLPLSCFFSYSADSNQ